MSVIPIESDNIFEAIKNYVYLNHIRPRTTPKIALVNGEFPVYAGRIYDSITRDKIDGHEIELLRGIDRCVASGDNVVIIGGGIGVSSIASAKHVGSNGKVHVFEAAGELVEPLKYSVHLNGMDEIIEVRHAAVGPVKSLWGKRVKSRSVDPSELPTCDVLVLDCEGAEAEILPQLQIRPNNIVVEHHRDLGAGKDLIHKELIALGYDIQDHEYEVESAGVGIFTAELSEETRDSS